MGDAIGSHTLQVQRVLEEMGLQSRLYVGEVAKEVPAETYPFPTYARRSAGGAGRKDTLLLYQASTGSFLGDFLCKRPEPKLLNYHNITPASDFEMWDARIAGEMDKGREELVRMARATLHAIADSAYNESELTEVGYSSTSVAPILFDIDSFDHPVDRPTSEWLQRQRERGGANLLFVGRVAPNKAHHDLLQAFAAYRRAYDPLARLYIVGGCPVPGYLRTLRRLAAALGIHEAVDFSGFVTAAELSAYYGQADVFVCLSDHEGFCVPLLEAMFHRLPIVAYRAAAVPETLGDAGILLDAKDPAMVAAAVHRAVSDESLSKALALAGERRLDHFTLERSRSAFRTGIETSIALVA